MENKFKVIKNECKIIPNKKGKLSYRYYQIIECIDCGYTLTISKGDSRRMKECPECNRKKYQQNFVGYKNGYFKVISFIENKNRRLYYMVECNRCKEKIRMRKDAIISTKSCIKCKGNGKIPSSDTMYKRHWDNYLFGAKLRGYNFDLTFNQFKDLVNKNCYYCGALPSIAKCLKKYNKTGKDIRFNGIDRVNSSCGYSLENCVPCCPMCNVMKMSHSKFDFLNHIEKIYNFSIACSTTIEQEEKSST